MTQSALHKGMLLIASPDMDPNFCSRGVILLCEHTVAGSFGLVINQDFPLDIPEELAPIADKNHSNVQFRLGGPIQQNQMLLLHTAETNKEQTMQIKDGIYLGGDLIFLQDSIQQETSPSFLLCFGYMGWLSGQLDKEFAEGLWFTHPAKTRHLFNIEPDKIWSSVLKEMGGKYASISMLPDDIHLN